MEWIDRAQWPYEARFFATPVGRMHHVDVGDGPITLFSHGTPTWAFEWRHLIRDLPGRRIAVDHLGFGLSDRPWGAGYRPEDHAARFAAFADHLDLRDVTLVLHDYGGPIALPWALANPDRVARLVVLNSFAWPLDDRPTRVLGRLLGSALGRWLYAYANLSLRFVAPSAWGDRRRLTSAIQAHYLAPFPEPRGRVEVLWPLARALLASRAFYADLEARLPALDVPVTLIWGARDPAFGPAHLARWQRHFPAARTTVVDHAGHWPHEEAPAEVLAAFRADVGYAGGGGNDSDGPAVDAADVGARRDHAVSGRR